MFLSIHFPNEIKYPLFLKLAATLRHLVLRFQNQIFGVLIFLSN